MLGFDWFIKLFFGKDSAPLILFVVIFCVGFAMTDWGWIDGDKNYIPSNEHDPTTGMPHNMNLGNEFSFKTENGKTTFTLEIVDQLEKRSIPYKLTKVELKLDQLNASGFPQILTMKEKDGVYVAEFDGELTARQATIFAYYNQTEMWRNHFSERFYGSEEPIYIPVTTKIHKSNVVSL